MLIQRIYTSINYLVVLILAVFKEQSEFTAVEWEILEASSACDSSPRNTPLIFRSRPQAGQSDPGAQCPWSLAAVSHAE